jgi:hypothetical protein
MYHSLRSAIQYKLLRYEPTFKSTRRDAGGSPRSGAVASQNVDLSGVGAHGITAAAGKHLMGPHPRFWYFFPVSALQQAHGMLKNIERRAN